MPSGLSLLSSHWFCPRAAQKLFLHTLPTPFSAPALCRLPNVFLWRLPACLLISLGSSESVESLSCFTRLNWNPKQATIWMFFPVVWGEGLEWVENLRWSRPNLVYSNGISRLGFKHVYLSKMLTFSSFQPQSPGLPALVGFKFPCPDFMIVNQPLTKMNSLNWVLESPVIGHVRSCISSKDGIFVFSFILRVCSETPGPE